MKNTLIAAACVLGLAGPAAAQYPTYGYPGGFGSSMGGGFGQYPFPSFPGVGPGVGGMYGPNVYNRQYQPLSPYLNLLRGGNTGVNYFYGVRPGTGGMGGGFGPGPGLAPGGFRAPFFQLTISDPDAIQLPDAAENYRLPPAGHPVVYNNTLGYFPGSFGGRGFRPGLGAGGIGGGSGTGGMGAGGGNRPTTGTPRR